MQREGWGGGGDRFISSRNFFFSILIKKNFLLIINVKQKVLAKTHHTWDEMIERERGEA